MPSREFLAAGRFALCALVSAPCLARAEAPLPPESPVNVKFDAPTGHFSENIRQAPCASTQLHTDIRIDKAYPDPGGKWASVVQIVINQTEPLGTQATLILLPAEHAQIELRKYSYQRAVDEIPFSAQASLGKSIDVTLSWTAEGSLSIIVNRSERHTIALGEPVRTVKFTSSGAKVEFDNVQFDAPASARQCGSKRTDI